MLSGSILDEVNSTHNIYFKAKFKGVFLRCHTTNAKLRSLNEGIFSLVTSGKFFPHVTNPILNSLCQPKIDSLSLASLWHSR